MALRDKRLFLLDMDGTIYLSDQLFDGTKDFLSYVRRIGGRYLFLTNNSSRGTEGYIEKLAHMGISASPEDFMTSADVAVEHFRHHPPSGALYVCGTEALKRKLRAAGLTVAETPDLSVSTVLLGYDTELTYQKLESCCILLGRGVDYLATHPDPVCPTWYGSAPDCGSIIELLFTATARRPLVLGKPKPAMALAAMEKAGFSPAQTCILGDRIYTDIACGLNAGIDSVFLLSGEGVLSDIEKYQIRPTYVFDNIRAFLSELEGAPA